MTNTHPISVLLLALLLAGQAATATPLAIAEPPHPATTTPASLRPASGLRSTEHIVCARRAAAAFRVPLAAVLILLDVEGGWVGAEQPNRSRTGEITSHDLGPMQINDRAWLKTFEAVGITREQLRDDACVNIHAGAWIYARHLSDIRRERSQGTSSRTDPPEVEALLRYHSRTEHFQQIYRGHIERSVARGLAAAEKAGYALR